MKCKRAHRDRCLFTPLGYSKMHRLALILHLFIGSTLAGSAMIAALVAGYDTLSPILIAAALGFVASIPVTIMVARKIYSAGQGATEKVRDTVSSATPN